jgi:chemotaxis protein MotB
MAKKQHHEEHVNTEAWAIPYGDLITLLLAFFVVMYSMSSVNEGKYRILSDSLVAAFRGTPKTESPIQIGKQAPGKGGTQLVGVRPTAFIKLKEQMHRGLFQDGGSGPPPNKGGGAEAQPASGALIRMAQNVQTALKSLIDKKLVTVHQEKLWLEVEIRTDILFKSGDANINAAAVPVLRSIADILKPFPNPIHVEGHTDNRPIRTSFYPSNWELSAARAATVVHLFVNQGVDPQRLKIVGLGEQHPIAGNDTPEGRNANRRVRIVVLQSADVAEDVYAVRQNADGAAAAAASQLGVAEPNGNNRVLLSMPAEELSKKLAPATPGAPPAGEAVQPAQPPPSK